MVGGISYIVNCLSKKSGHIGILDFLSVIRFTDQPATLISLGPAVSYEPIKLNMILLTVLLVTLRAYVLVGK